MANYRTLPKNAVITHRNVTLTRNNLGGSYLGWPINHLGDSVFNDANAELNYDRNPSNAAGKELLDTSAYVYSFRNHRPNAPHLYDFYGQGGPVLGPQAMHNFLRTLDFWHAKSAVTTHVLGLWSAKSLTDPLINSTYQSTTTNTAGTGAKTFFIPAGKTLTGGLSVFVYQQGNSGGLFMRGTITSYNSTTGELVTNMTSNTGTASNSNWRVAVFVGTRYTDGYEQEVINYLYKILGFENTTTSISIGLGSKSFTVTNTHRLYTTNNFLRVQSAANAANFVFGQVTAYDNATSSCTINVTTIGGSGSFSDGRVYIASANNRILANHPALANVEVSNEQMTDTGTTQIYQEFARISRYVNKIFKLLSPATTITGDTCDQGRRTLTSYLLASAAGTLTVEGDNGTGKQACEYLDGIGFNNYTFGNGSFANHKEMCETNGYAGAVENGSMSVVENSIQSMMKYNSTSAWLGRTNRPKIIIGEHSIVGAATDINSFAQQSVNWSHGASTKQKAFWDVTRYLIPAILQTSDGLGGLGIVHFYALDNAGSNETSGTISQASIGAHTTGEIKFTISVAPQVPFSANLLEKRIVITAPAGGWTDLGLAANEKKRFVVRQIAGNEVYIVGSQFNAAPSATVTYTQFHADWSPFPEDIKEVYDTFFNVPLTIGKIYDSATRDIAQVGKTKRKFAGLFIVVPDIGTNTQYAGTYYINGSEIGSKW